MISSGPQLRRLQDEVYHRLMSETLFADVSIFRERAGEISDEQINLALTTLGTRAGKIGAVLIVLMPRVEKAAANNPGPRFDAQVTVRVLVTPVFNNAPDTGTGKSEDELALGVLHCLHQFKPGGLAPQLLPDRDKPLEPYKEAIEAGTAGYDVTHVLDWGLEGGDKCATPAITGTASEVTLSTATSGASIYFTTDGTYPGSGNPAAALYTAPFPADAGAQLRCAAEHIDLVASNVVERTLS